MEEECGFPDIHGGKIETSLMLVFAPHLVRTEGIAATRPNSPTECDQRPDPRSWCEPAVELGERALAIEGVTGDATVATAQFGQQIVESLLGNVRTVLAQLRERGAR